MERMHTSKVQAYYDKETKTLYLDTRKIDVLPSYLYYVCEYLENKEKITIDLVVFNSNTEQLYKMEDLKGKRDWSEVKCVNES